MVGCAVLAAQAALRCGVGLLTLGFPKSLYSVYTRRLTEAMFLPLPETAKGALSRKASIDILKFSKTQDVLAFGPGLSREHSTQELIREITAKCRLPLVIDADGLFPFSGKARELKKICAPFILTPHAGEFERLFKIEPGKSLHQRKQAAQQAASLSGGVVVLKGHETIVAGPAGEIYINKTGNPGLAKGGTGDVLFGMIASFFVQKLSAFQAASLGVHLHGLAADLAAQQVSQVALLASDVVQALPRILRRFEKK